jgi:hypothetical protein
MNQISIRSPIARDESIAGYLTRLAEYNGYRSSSWFFEHTFHWISKNKSTLDSGYWSQETIQTVMNLTGLTEDTISQRLYKKVGAKQRTFFGHTVPEKFIDWISSKSARKFCPECVRDFGYHSGLFDLSLIQICPLHCRRLSKCCPHCTEPTKWGHPSIRYCEACKGDLADADTDRIAPSDMSGILFIAAEVGFPHLIPTTSDALAKWPEELAHLSFSERIDLIVRMSFYLQANSDGKGEWYFSQEGKDSVHQALSQGLRYLSDWPHGFVRYLDDLKRTRQASNSEQRFGLHNDFGWFYTRWLRKNGEPWTTLRGHFEQYLKERWDGFTPERGKRINLESPNGPAVGLIKATDALGHSKHRLKALAQAGRVSAKRVGIKSKDPLLFDEGDLAQLPSVADLPSGLEKAAQYLGVTRRTMRMLVEARVVTPLLGPTISDFSRFLVPIAQLNEIKSQIFANISVPASDRHCSFNLVLGMCRQSHIPLDLMIQSMRSGTLSHCSIIETGSGLNDLKFELELVRSWICEISFAAHNPQPIVSLWVAAKYLKIKLPTAKCLVEDNKIQAPSGTLGKHRMQVYRSSVLEFEATYVRAWELKQEHRTKITFLVDLLSDLGVEPLRYNSGNLWDLLYEQSLVESVDLESALRRTRRPKRRSNWFTADGYAMPL